MDARSADDCDLMSNGVDAEPDDFEMFPCHGETGPAFRCMRWDPMGHTGREVRQDGNRIPLNRLL